MEEETPPYPVILSEAKNLVVHREMRCFAALSMTQPRLLLTRLEFWMHLSGINNCFSSRNLIYLWNNGIRRIPLSDAGRHRRRNVTEATLDFREAESRFLQLQENYQNRAISEESFFQSVSKLMVQDSRGVYWTIDPRTGNWLFYDGHVWQRSVPPTKEITQRIKPVPKHRRATGWALVLSLGGLAFFVTLFVAAVFAYRAFVVAYPPKVEVRTPNNGARVPVGEAVTIETVSTSPKGLRRVELWVDDQLVLPETNVASGTVVSVTFPWIFQEAGSHVVRVKAYSSSHAIGESAPVLVEALPPVNADLPSLVVLEGSADVRSGEQEPWRPVEGSPYLQVGQSIRTHANGRVQLVFSNDAVAELGENTEVLLREATASSADSPHIGLFLAYGDTWHRLDADGMNLVYEVETASARVVSQKTLLHVTSDPAQETLVEVVEGAAVLSGAGQSVRLGAGQKARVGAGKPPVLLSPEPLPTINLMATSTVRPGG